ncbi:MAG: V-type ATP synthase subunit F [Candidatus Anstonellales archaeon]
MANHEMEKEKIIAVGDNIFCSAFMLTGIETIEAYNEEKLIEVMSKNVASIIIVQEELFSNISNKTKKHIMQSLKPAVISLSLEGISQAESLDQLIKRSLGVSIK